MTGKLIHSSLADIVYETKEDAIKAVQQNLDLVDTIKIEWEE